MKFIPYEGTLKNPNIIVDGTANEATVLTLSHWRQSGTPEPLLGDTSAEIVFNYLDSPQYHVDASVVSNNHFDEDGLVGVFSLIDPEFAFRHRELLIAVANAGDFRSGSESTCRQDCIHTFRLCRFGALAFAEIYLQIAIPGTCGLTL